MRGGLASVRRIRQASMPFTAAHPAAILPLVRLFGVPYATSALAIGSVTPDFEYFLRLKPVSTVSHSLSGLFVFCLPAGLVGLVVFHTCIKRPLTLLLPDDSRRRLASTLTSRRITPHELWRTPLLVLLGAVTHIAWDGFTHTGGWAVMLWPVLSVIALSVGGIEIPIYKVVQHASTLLGIVVLSANTTLWLRRQAAAPEEFQSLPATARACIVVAIAMTALFVGILAALGGGPGPSDSEAFRMMAGRFVVGCMSGLILAVVVYGVWFRIARLT